MNREKDALRPLKLLIWLLAGFACVAQAAAEESQFLPPRPQTEAGDPLAVVEPETKLLIIFLSGSDPEFDPDRCLPAQPDSYWGVPGVIAGLAGRRIAGRQVLVYGFCSPTRLGSYDAETRSGRPKVVGRAADLTALLLKLGAKGFEPGQIFLAGHSAGAWAALLAARRDPSLHNAIIAFAPAFSGARADRDPGWRVLRREQVAYLSAAPSIDVLLYAFRGDRFNQPRDLGFLKRIQGVEFHAIPFDEIGGISCAGIAPHHAMRQNCFAKAETERIVDYITRRVGPPD